MERENLYSKEELLLKEIQDHCDGFADGIITRVCKRAIRRINSWGQHALPDGYPSKFTNFDILSVELQSKYYSEISPYLEDAVGGALESEYKRLSPEERFFVNYSECYYDEGFDWESIIKKIRKRFHEMLNEHYSNSKKIEDYLWRL